MKLLVAPNRKRSGQIMAEACIGLALMVFTWLIVTYSLYMANNHIRTEMAARYAAWYAGNNNGTAPTPANIDQYFFFQSGLSVVHNWQAEGIADALTGATPPANSYTSDGSGNNGPWRMAVEFGLVDPNMSPIPYPFNMVRSVPFMGDPGFSIGDRDACQWDGDSDTWSDWSDAAKGVWNALSSNVKDLFSL